MEVYNITKTEDIDVRYRKFDKEDFHESQFEGKIEQLEQNTEELKILKQWLAAPSKRGIYKFVR